MNPNYHSPPTYFRVTTAILGGGLSGLTLARLLHERGEDGIVLEAEHDYGGLCRSVEENGFTFDIGGSHIIFSRDAEVLAFMRRMITGNEKRNNRNTKIFYKNRYVKYPFENGLADLPPDDRFFCINEFVKAQIAFETGSVPQPSNFREWISFTFGKGIADCYMVPYNEKIWKYPTDRMSHHWVEGRIPRPPIEDVIKSAIGIPTEGYTHQSVFSYPATGRYRSAHPCDCRTGQRLDQDGFLCPLHQKIRQTLPYQRRDRDHRSGSLHLHPACPAPHRLP